MSFRFLGITLAATLLLFTVALKNDVALSAAQGPVKVEVSSKRIPVGTPIEVKMGTSINTVSSNVGDQFYATLTKDIKTDKQVVLPAGTVIRGTIGEVKRSKLLSYGGEVLLMFDHIVTPVGKQVPIYAYIENNEFINYAGNITSGMTYGTEFQKGFEKSKDITVVATKWGVDTGLKSLKGVPVVLTAPIGAIGGFLGGTGYFLGSTIYSVFKKGEDVFLAPGQLLTIKLAQPLDIPLN